MRFHNNFIFFLNLVKHGRFTSRKVSTLRPPITCLSKDVNVTITVWQYFKNSKCILLWRKNQLSKNVVSCFSTVPKRVGFTKPCFKLNRKAQKYIVNVQWLNNDDTKKIEKLCMDIRKDANSFDVYEIIDIVYHLSKCSYKDVYATIEPLLFHFFLKYNNSIHLNGIALHRLLRVLTEYQDLVYREWIYSIAKILSKKHAHISMRDIQLILDDLALFYDFQIQCQIIPFYKTLINRLHELEIKRLPFIMHVIGRIGCNDERLLNIIYKSLYVNIKKPDLYRSDFAGLILRGLANLKMEPDEEFLHNLYTVIKESIHCTHIKYLSWCADGFARLNCFYPLPLLINQIAKMKNQISHLELIDFASILNSLQANLLATRSSYGIKRHKLEFRDTLREDPLVRDEDSENIKGEIERKKKKEKNKTTDIRKELKTDLKTDFKTDLKTDLKTELKTDLKTEMGKRNNKEIKIKEKKNLEVSNEELYDMYKILEKLIVEKVSESIYNGTPPYRVILFELLTRLFRFYSNPIDLIVEMKTHRYDTSLLLKKKNNLQALIISNQEDVQKSNSGLSFSLKRFPFQNDFFWGNQENQQNEETTNLQNLQTEENLPKLFKNFLHAIFFRTPALGGRTLMLLLIGLVRIHFGKREKEEYEQKKNTNILPFMKASEIYRPFTKCIIREMIRKIETFNSEELIICSICLNELDAFSLDQELFVLTMERLLILKKNNFINGEQLEQLKKLLIFWFTKREDLISHLSFSTIKQVKEVLL